MHFHSAKKKNAGVADYVKFFKLKTDYHIITKKVLKKTLIFLKTFSSFISLFSEATFQKGNARRK